MKNEPAHKAWWQIFEVVCGIPFLIGVVMQRVVPFSLPRADASPVFVSAGIVLLLPASVACHYILIVPEEQYLGEKFGEAYRLYTEKVYRWIGRKMGIT